MELAIYNTRTISKNRIHTQGTKCIDALDVDVYCFLIAGHVGKVYTVELHFRLRLSWGDRKSKIVVDLVHS